MFANVATRCSVCVRFYCAIGVPETFFCRSALSHYEKFRSERVNWITASSDGLMKMLINMNSEILSSIQTKIRENGPLNVQGWKKLLATKPLNERSVYIEKHKTAKTGELIRAKL